MLRWRLLLGTIFIAALIGLCWLDHTYAPGIVLLPLALLLSLAAGHELLWLVNARKLQPLPWVVHLGNMLIVASNLVPRIWPESWPPDPLGYLGWPLAMFALLLLVAFLGEMRRYTAPGEVMERLALAVFALGYIGVLFSFVCQMRWLGNGAAGIPAIAVLVIVVKACDIGAYTIGRLFGKHKMAPVLSPGKTMEGAAGGLALACLSSWLAFTFLVPFMAPNLPAPRPWGWLLYGLLVGAAGMLGDLAESLIKRDVGRKDSSDWMPGFGGVLDLLDSILIASPVAYLCWAFGLVP